MVGLLLQSRAEHDQLSPGRRRCSSKHFCPGKNPTATGNRPVFLYIIHVNKLEKSGLGRLMSLLLDVYLYIFIEYNDLYKYIYIYIYIHAYIYTWWGVNAPMQLCAARCSHATIMILYERPTGSKYYLRKGLGCNFRVKHGFVQKQGNQHPMNCHSFPE